MSFRTIVAARSTAANSLDTVVFNIDFTNSRTLFLFYTANIIAEFFSQSTPLTSKHSQLFILMKPSDILNNYEYNRKYNIPTCIPNTEDLKDNYFLQVHSEDQNSSSSF